MADLVEEWKALARARMAREMAPHPTSAPRVHVQITLGFALACAVLGLHYGMAGPVAASIVLAAFASCAALGIEVAARADERSGASGLADQADARLRECNPAAAVELAERALAAARSPRLRRKLWTTLAWAAIGKRDPFLAHEAIASLPARALDFHLVAAYLACCNRADEAEQLLGEARGLGHRDPETTKLLIDLFVRRGNASAALELARDDDRLLSDDDRAAIEAALPTSSSAQS